MVGSQRIPHAGLFLRRLDFKRPLPRSGQSAKGLGQNPGIGTDRKAEWVKGSRVASGKPGQRRERSAVVARARSGDCRELQEVSSRDARMTVAPIADRPVTAGRTI